MRQHMSNEIHVVIAESRAAAIAKVVLIAGDRKYITISSGWKERVSFQDLAEPESGYDRSANGDTMYCAIARIAD
jgi:hypothetical protein